MMLALLLALTFAESKTLAVQLCLDREGMSCNTIDGSWGRKSQNALERYCAENKTATPATPEAAYDTLFGGTQAHLFCRTKLTSEDFAQLVRIPDDPAARAALTHMGYATILEMLAERGHLSERALARLNPRINWQTLAPGMEILLPDFPSIEKNLASWPRPKSSTSPTAHRICVSLSRFEITAYDAFGRLLASFPCSIARERAKLPQRRDLKIITQIAHPNYTYTPDRMPAGGKTRRYVWPPGPNCPVGVAWLGLDLPGYGIHGTPHPERIGCAESHGCFRLANWNAARLYALAPVGTRVVITE